MDQAAIAALAQSAGLTPERAKVAAAIAMAESGGNPNNHNPRPPDNSYGLWQINMIGGLGPARRRQFGLSRNEDLFDPMTNARAMAAISHRGGNFVPWTTYTHGTYKKYMSGNAAGSNTATDADWKSVIPGYDEGKALWDITQYVEKAATWLSNSDNWIRIAYISGGLFVAGIGIVMVLDSTRAGKAFNRTVAGAAGTAAKAAAL